jgi:hypothetical protein
MKRKFCARPIGEALTTKGTKGALRKTFKRERTRRSLTPAKFGRIFFTRAVIVARPIFARPIDRGLHLGYIEVHVFDGGAIRTSG